MFADVEVEYPDNDVVFRRGFEHKRLVPAAHEALWPVGPEIRQRTAMQTARASQGLAIDTGKITICSAAVEISWKYRQAF